MKSMLAATLMAFGLAIGLAGSCNADTFTLNNDNGGDGYVVAIPGGFDLFGADNGFGNNYTTYTATAATSETLTYNWTYTTNDCCGAGWDPGGYVINGVYTALSPYVFGPQGTGDSSGVVTLTVLAGQNYGFYVYSPDSCCGRGDIAVNATPLPAALPMFAAGLGLVGWLARRRKQMGSLGPTYSSC